MIKELRFKYAPVLVPDTYDNVILFTREQPMSLIGYYDLDNKKWYLQNSGGYDSAIDCGEEVEWWAELPMNI